MIELTESQNAAIEELFSFMVSEDKQFFVLKGYSGTGKTTLINHFLRNMKGYCDSYRLIDPNFINPFVQCTATTHKAAQVLEDKINREVTTIHALLSLRLTYDYKTGNEFIRPSGNPDSITESLKYSLLIIDEISMAGRSLLKHIYQLVHPTTKVIFIGDPYQLPPVKEMESIVFSNKFPEATLEGVQRQDADSAIPLFGEQMRETIKTGKFKPIPFNNFDLIHLEGPDFQHVIDNNFNDRHFGLHNKVLAWSNKRVIEYNNYIRSLFTTEDAPQQGEIYVSHGVVRRHDETVLNNNQEVIIEECREDEYKNLPTYRLIVKCLRNNIRRHVHIPINKEDFDKFLKQLANESRKNGNWAEYFAWKESVADLRPNYALTCHKSQGSTYDNVFIDLYDIGRNRNPNEVARILYVAATRARNQAIFTGHLPKEYGGC